MNKIIYTLACVIICSFCEKEAENQETEDKNESYSSESGIIEEIPVYSKCSNYNNNLSEVASEITFIPLNSDPPINEDHITSIELTDNDIFLSTSSSIMRFDKNGKYIKNIGRAGQGPQEYVNITYTLQLDRKNRLIYANDINRQRVLVYNFDGNFQKAFPLNAAGIELIDSSTIALRQTLFDIQKPNCFLIRFIDTNGKEIKSYKSWYYPIDGRSTEILGSVDLWPLWKNKQSIYYLESGTDTIFSIQKNSLIPSRVLIGELKLSFEEFFRKRVGNKLRLMSPFLKPNSAIFESDTFMIFRLFNDSESFFMIYDKKKKKLHRTFHKNAVESRSGNKQMDYFFDDMVSGLSFDPKYQSEDKAISLIPAWEICEKKQEILDFIDKHSNHPQSKLLKSVIQKMTDDDNPLMIAVTFK